MGDAHISLSVRHERLIRIAFLFVTLSTPFIPPFVLPFLSGVVNDNFAMLSFYCSYLGGGFISALLAARLRARTRRSFIVLTLIFWPAFTVFAMAISTVIWSA